MNHMTMIEAAPVAVNDLACPLLPKTVPLAVLPVGPDACG